MKTLTATLRASFALVVAFFLPASALGADRVVAVRANVNSKFVSFPGPNLQLIANMANAIDNQFLVVVPQPGGHVALRSKATGMYVAAESAGAAPLIANRPAVGAWELFDIVSVGGNTVALRAVVNGLYVAAENAGASTLIANRPAVGAWEQFTLVDVSLPNASPGIAPITTVTTPLDGIPVLSPESMKALLASGGFYLAAKTSARLQAAEWSASLNSPKGLGVIDGYIEVNAQVSSSIAIVASDLSVDVNGRIQATQLTVVAVKVTGIAPWVVRNPSLAFSGVVEPSCVKSSAIRGCAPLPGEGNAPVRIAGSLDSNAGLPEGVLLSAERLKSPLNASGRTVELDLLPAAVEALQPNRYVCAGRIHRTDCPSAAPVEAALPSYSSLMTFPPSVVMIAEEDFLNMAPPQLFSNGAANLAAELVAAGNLPSAIGVTGEIAWGGSFGTDLLVVARGALTKGGLVTASEYYLVPMSVEGSASWVGRNLGLAFSTVAIPSYDLTLSSCGPVSVVGRLPYCKDGCPTPPHVVNQTQGAFGYDRIVSGLDRVTMHTFLPNGPVIDVQAMACSLLQPPLVHPPSGYSSSCAALETQCDGLDDNCNGLVDEDDVCVPLQICPCVPKTCTGLSLTCGSPPDGCGGVLFCGGVCQ